MNTYKEHYQHCREVNPIEGGVYNSVYDLTVDDTLFNFDNHIEVIKTIREKINDKIDKNVGCFKDSHGHAIRVNDWRDIKELYTLTEYFMPIIEKNIFKVENYEYVTYIYVGPDIAGKEGAEEFALYNTQANLKRVIIPVQKSYVDPILFLPYLQKRNKAQK